MRSARVTSALSVDPLLISDDLIPHNGRHPHGVHPQMAGFRCSLIGLDVAAALVEPVHLLDGIVCGQRLRIVRELSQRGKLHRLFADRTDAESVIICGDVKEPLLESHADTGLEHAHHRWLCRNHYDCPVSVLRDSHCQLLIFGVVTDLLAGEQ